MRDIFFVFLAISGLLITQSTIADPWEEFTKELENSKKGGKISIFLRCPSTKKQMRSRDGSLSKKALGSMDIVGLFIPKVEKRGRFAATFRYRYHPPTSLRNEKALSKICVANNPQRISSPRDFLVQYDMYVGSLEEARLLYSRLFDGRVWAGLHRPDRTAANKIEEGEVVDDRNKQLYYPFVDITQALRKGKALRYEDYQDNKKLTFAVDIDASLHFMIEHPHWDEFCFVISGSSKQQQTVKEGEQAWAEFMHQLGESGKAGKICIYLNSKSVTKQWRNILNGVLETQQSGRGDVVGLFVNGKNGSESHKTCIASKPLLKREFPPLLLQQFELRVADVKEAQLLHVKLFKEGVWAGLSSTNSSFVLKEINNEVNWHGTGKSEDQLLMNLTKALQEGEKQWSEDLEDNALMFMIDAFAPLHFMVENPHWEEFMVSIEAVQEGKSTVMHRIAIQPREVPAEIKGVDLKDHLALYTATKDKHGVPKPKKLYAAMMSGSHAFVHHVEGVSEAISAQSLSFIVALRYQQESTDAKQPDIHIYYSEKPSTFYLGEVLQEAKKARVLRGQLEQGEAGKPSEAITYEVAYNIPLSLYLPVFTPVWSNFLRSLQKTKPQSSDDRGVAEITIEHALKIQLGVVRKKLKTKKSAQGDKPQKKWEEFDVVHGTLGLFNAKLDNHDEWHPDKLLARSDSSHHSFTIPVDSEEAANQYYVQGFFVMYIQAVQAKGSQAEAAGQNLETKPLNYEPVGDDPILLGAVLRESGGKIVNVDVKGQSKQRVYYEAEYKDDVLFKRNIVFQMPVVD